MLYGYCRVSTVKQSKNGQSLKDQVAQLRKAGVENKNIYRESFTGTTTDRPEFDKLLNHLQSGDTLVVAKLDRLARNLRESLNVIHDLQEKNVTIKVLSPDMTVNNDIGGKIMYQTLLMVADIEHDMILSRTQAGKEYARQNKKNYRDGRPKNTVQSTINKVPYETIYNDFKSNTAKNTADKFGISKRTVYRIAKLFKEYDQEHHNSAK